RGPRGAHRLGSRINQLTGVPPPESVAPERNTEMTGRRRGSARLRTPGRALTVLTVASTAVLLAAACTPGAKKKDVAPAGQDASGTVEFWHPFTDRESDAVDAIVKDFQASHPKIKVTVKGGQDDDKMTQAIGAGQGP